MSATDKELVMIVGPTASGKTEAALSLAQRGNGAVISADSRQVYLGMNVGTAKPAAVGSELHDDLTYDLIAGVPHYLFNIRRPDQELTLADWRTSAYQAIDYCFDHDQKPIVAGGTMLYIDSILYNYTLPAVPPNPEFRRQQEAVTLEALYQELQTKDPEATKFIDAQNKRRIIRALEVIAATGQPFSAQRRHQPPRYTIALHGIFPGWELLESRIKQRTATMLTEGLLAETQHLIDSFGSELPLLQTINYAQAVQVILGERTAPEASEEMFRANLRYAHRQMSWWKNRDVTWHTTASDVTNTVKLK